jgi:hypothetical protein
MKILENREKLEWAVELDLPYRSAVSAGSADRVTALAWRIYFVPEGQSDRSQARSAWEACPQKNRPVGYGMIERS